MKLKHSLITFILGYCIDFVGSLFKIMHWKYGDELIITATVLKVVGALFFLLKAINHPKVKEFLNW